MMKRTALQNEDLVFLAICTKADSALMKSLEALAIDNGAQGDIKSIKFPLMLYVLWCLYDKPTSAFSYSEGKDEIVFHILVRSNIEDAYEIDFIPFICQLQ